MYDVIISVEIVKCRLFSQKQVIIDLVRKGVSQSEVAQLFNVNRCTVYHIIRRFEETTNDLGNLPKSRRPNLQ